MFDTSHLETAIVLIAGRAGLDISPAAASLKPKPTITGLTLTPAVVSSRARWLIDRHRHRGQCNELHHLVNTDVLRTAGDIRLLWRHRRSRLVPPLNASTKKKASYDLKLTATGPYGVKVKGVRLKVLPSAGAGSAGDPLAGATAVVSDASGLNNDGYCALATSGEVDCWGEGQDGELGDGSFYPSVPYGSATPVPVLGVGGIGLLTGVTDLVSDRLGACALLTSGGVDCWGDGTDGELGDGSLYSTGPDGSDIPVPVLGIGGAGILTGVFSLASAGFGYCALLISGSVDCWGDGYDGELGDGSFYTSSPQGSDTPVEVVGVGDAGNLTGVASLFSAQNLSGADDSFRNFRRVYKDIRVVVARSEGLEPPTF